MPLGGIHIWFLSYIKKEQNTEKTRFCHQKQNPSTKIFVTNIEQFWIYWLSVFLVVQGWIKLDGKYLNHVLRKSKIRSYKYVKSYLRN